MTTILDNEYVTLMYEDDHALLYDRYTVNIDLATIQSSLDAGLEKINETGANKWLTNTHAIGGFSEDVAQWVLEDWGPRAIEAGWKYWALVVPEEMEGRLAMVQFVSAFNEMGVLVRVYTAEDEAREWVLGVE